MYSLLKLQQPPSDQELQFIWRHSPTAPLWDFTKFVYKLLPSDRALAKRPARQVHRDEGNRSRGGEHSGQPGGQVLTPGSRYLDQRWSIYSPQNGILLAKSYL